MSNRQHMDTITVNGIKFDVFIEDDDHSDPPWEESDGHGPVEKGLYRHRTGVNTDKTPGQRPLNDPDRNQYQFYYDWQVANQLAKRDGWGLAEAELEKLKVRLGREPTKGELRHAAVQADFDYLRGWVNDDWRYIGVMVQAVGMENDPTCMESCWGVESFGDHWKEVAKELAEEQASGLVQEAMEIAYWAERGIITEGEHDAPYL